ncbi:unnamed protein product [Toxocara canis]|uniref:DOMON domain-containing protein n=1 Tax=Toxocara canis TaxID=6265 RepID=A0A183VA80_TOXCA|nr:unnamed protein product [Toxocara canis]
MWTKDNGFHIGILNATPTYSGGHDKEFSRNGQIYPVNDSDIVDLDEVGLAKMSRLRPARAVPPEIAEVAFVTGSSDDTESIATVDSSVKSSDGSSVDQHKTIAKNLEEMNASKVEDQSREKIAVNEKDGSSKHFDSETSANHTSTTGNTTGSVKEDPEVKSMKVFGPEQLENQLPFAVTTESSAPTTTATTVITEVTLTIEPPFEKILVEPLCTINGPNGC